MQESADRTQSLHTQQIEESFFDYLSESSMETHSSDQLKSFGVEFECDGRLRFDLVNKHGALIYKDFLGRYAVKIEDHVSDFDPAPWVSFQEDRYMSRDAVMYLIVEDPETVDKLGNIVPEGFDYVEEASPELGIPGLRMVNSIRAQRVLIDDATKALYKREDAGLEFLG